MAGFTAARRAALSAASSAARAAALAGSMRLDGSSGAPSPPTPSTSSRSSSSDGGRGGSGESDLTGEGDSEESDLMEGAAGREIRARLAADSPPHLTGGGGVPAGRAIITRSSITAAVPRTGRPHAFAWVSSLPAHWMEAVVSPSDWPFSPNIPGPPAPLLPPSSTEYGSCLVRRLRSPELCTPICCR